MSVQLWDNGVQVCDVQKNLDRKTTHKDKPVDFDCGDGRSLRMENNGRKLTYEAPDGSITLDASDRQQGLNANVCALGRGFEFKNVFDNGKCTNCSMQKLCRWVVKCYEFDGKYS